MNRSASILTIIALTSLLSACNSQPTRPRACTPPAGPDLAQAMNQARQDLGTGCELHFDDYFQRLLTIAEGDPKADNKARFSEFLVWSNDQGLLSKRQARARYNRYFGVKYVALMGDYSVCSQTCPHRRQVLDAMQQELGDKEQGLLRIAADASGYQRAHHLLGETELVLEATCSACNPGE